MVADHADHAGRGIDDPEEAAYLLLCLSADILRYRGDMTWEDVGLVTMLFTHEGRCEDMTNLAIYAMRANALPVTSDYTPYWANSGNNHAWNAILGRDGEVLPW